MDKRYVITDGIDVFGLRDIKPEDLSDADKKIEEATGGNLYYAELEGFAEKQVFRSHAELNP